MGELVREEPAVETDDDFFFCAGDRMGGPVVGSGLSDALDVGEGEFLSEK